MGWGAGMFGGVLDRALMFLAIKEGPFLLSKLLDSRPDC